MDHYAVLGVGRTAGAAEIRRAYRLLALRHHPDRAGSAATATFQRIAEAYRVLSDTRARSSYDARLAIERPSPSVPLSPRQRGEGQGEGPPPIERLSGRLELLVARGLARRTDDGIVELTLTPAEADRGGTIVLDAVLHVPCPTCGGVAERHHLWCRTCEFEGTVLDAVTVQLTIPPLVPDRAAFALPIDRFGRVPPMRIRIRR